MTRNAQLHNKSVYSPLALIFSRNISESTSTSVKSSAELSDSDEGTQTMFLAERGRRYKKENQLLELNCLIVLASLILKAPIAYFLRLLIFKGGKAPNRAHIKQCHPHAKAKSIQYPVSNEAN